MPPVYAAYSSELTGNPLLTAREIAAMLNIQAKTVHQWRLRGRIQPAGLSDRGEHLFDAVEAATLEASPVSRGRRAARGGI